MDEALAELAVSGLWVSYGRLLERFRRKLDQTPSRHWNEIGWIHRIGRLGLIAGFLVLIFSPLWWLMPH